MRYFFIVIALFFPICQNLSAQTTFTIQVTTMDESCEKGKAQAEINGSTSSYTINWSTGENTTAISNLNAGNYSIKIIYGTEEDTTVYFNINKVDCPVDIPNFFSPNDDGYNDTWSIGKTQYFPNFELTVFNRWGQLVHKQTGIYIPWKGTYLGTPLPDGAYYYIFFYDITDRKNFIKGDISILR